MLLDERELAGEGEDFELFPFGGGEGGLRFGGEEPFVEEEFEAEAGGEDMGIGREFFEVEAGESVEVGGAFTGKLGAEEILRDGSCRGEGVVIGAQFEEGIEKSCILQGVDLFVRFAVDPFGKAEGGKFCGGCKERDESVFRRENFEDFFLAEIGD